jgi:hypothetical protein
LLYLDVVLDQQQGPLRLVLELAARQVRGPHLLLEFLVLLASSPYLELLVVL